jgi:hypothetical protein
MIGESFSRMGEYAKALEHYTSALRLYLQHSDWMLRVEFPAAVGPTQRSIATPWGVSKRASRPAHIPSKMLTLQGGAQVVGQQIVVGRREALPLHATEVARCTALALYRRWQIMGPVAAHDPLTNQLTTALSRRPGPPNHWSQAWIDVQLGMAYAAAGKPAQAASSLQQSLVLGGQYDHPLTSLALLGLGRLSFGGGQYNAASNYFYEATFPAAAYDQYSLMEEALRAGAATHTISGQRGAYPPLGPAAAWAHRNSRAMEVGVEVAAAENLNSSGDALAASKLLEHARRAMGRSEMAAGEIGSMLNYQTALVNFQRANLTAGSRAFEASMAFQRKSSLWLFQINIADGLYTTGAISDRVADMLYANLLREPTSADWALNPMETMGIILTPHPLPMEHWFEVAIVRKELEKAIEIADRIRRHRFFSSLSMGGRLLSLRWILEAPEGALSEAALLQRRDLLTRYPGYAELKRQVQASRAALGPLSLLGDDDDQRKQIKGHLSRIGELSAQQELILRTIALKRDPSDFVFPPKLNFKDLRARMPTNRLVLSYFSTSRAVYAFAVSKENYAHWQVDAPGKIRLDIRTFLKQLGNLDGGQAIGDKVLLDEEWKQTARMLLASLTNNADVSVWDQYSDLVIVPDGELWYLPFEALLVEGDDEPLITKTRIRYAPTVSLSQPDRRGYKPKPQTAVVTGKVVPRDEADNAELAYTAIRRALPDSQRLPTRLEVSSALLGTRFDRLVVISDLDNTTAGPYGWAPAHVDAGKAGSSLSHWLALPWGGPTEVVLPGFRTPAEMSLKKGGSGAEVFLSVCGVMATGARSVLISRWRVGGQSTRDLMREYVQELPYTDAASAWQRSVQLNRGNELDPAAEPRLNPPESDRPPTAQHPFFWSGYFVADTGASPVKPVAAPAAPKAPVVVPKRAAPMPPVDGKAPAIPEAGGVKRPEAEPAKPGKAINARDF